VHCKLQGEIFNGVVTGLPHEIQVEVRRDLGSATDDIAVERCQRFAAIV
jgi:hypothetical protein